MSSSERAERAALVLILLTVGLAAGWASFTHVHDWTMRNSPPGTPDAFGWVNACVSELVPIAALLTIRQRRRAGQSFRYPMFLLVAAAVLSLAAQLAVAKPGVSGWVLSAVPALAFMALSKLVLSSSGDSASVPALAHSDAATEVPAEQREAVADVGANLTRMSTSTPVDSPEVPPKTAKRRRPAAETRRLAVAMLAEQPEPTKEDVAARLDISPRRLRAVLASA
ncbi:DUF2637 domain-containing protein [Actinoplanes sp. NPDC051861]|uniref:DUF2637 domain-containing protein n=1 Tax=Actinoplanes sp. NPDC051861 TaxID=3155170 RepID=UPI0034449545